MEAYEETCGCDTIIVLKTCPMVWSNWWQRKSLWRFENECISTCSWMILIKRLNQRWRTAWSGHFLTRQPKAISLSKRSKYRTCSSDEVTTPVLSWFSQQEETIDPVGGSIIITTKVIWNERIFKGQIWVDSFRILERGRDKWSEHVLTLWYLKNVPSSKNEQMLIVESRRRTGRLLQLFLAQPEVLEQMW